MVAVLEVLEVVFVAGVVVVSGPLVRRDEIGSSAVRDSADVRIDGATFDRRSSAMPGTCSAGTAARSLAGCAVDVGSRAALGGTAPVGDGETDRETRR